jgi:glycosyltransferase involved in cell wall biosynthesis
MRVAFLIEAHMHYTVELANALAEEHDVMLVARDLNTEVSSADKPVGMGEFLEDCLDSRVRRDILGYGRLDIKGAFEMLRVYREIRSFSPDVLHLQENSDWRIYLIARLFGYERVVLTVHDVFWHPGESRRKYAWQVSSYLRKRAGKVIVHGDYLKEQFSRLFPGSAARIFTVHHGSYSIFRQWDEGSVREEEGTVLFFGRLTRYKGIEHLLEAAPLIRKAVPGLKIILAGRDSDWKDYFGALHDQMKGDPVFEVHNRFIPNEEVPAFFRRASLVVIPYVEASQSGVMSVAFAFGKPVVATRVGGFPEVMEDGRTGILVPPGDHRALAGAVIKILTDSALRKAMGERALRKSETDLSWEAAARKTAEVYAAPPWGKAGP